MLKPVLSNGHPLYLILYLYLFAPFPGQATPRAKSNMCLHGCGVFSNKQKQITGNGFLCKKMDDTSINGHQKEACKTSLYKIL